jgi:hypothetical protein
MVQSTPSGARARPGARARRWEQPTTVVDEDSTPGSVERSALPPAAIGCSERSRATKCARLRSKKWACESGYARACNNLGMMFQYGTGVGKDEARAAELYKQACHGGDLPGCSNLGLMYAQGTGASKDEARAWQGEDRCLVKTLCRAFCPGAIALVAISEPALESLVCELVAAA